MSPEVALCCASLILLFPATLYMASILFKFTRAMYAHGRRIRPLLIVMTAAGLMIGFIALMMLIARAQ